MLLLDVDFKKNNNKKQTNKKKKKKKQEHYQSTCQTVWIQIRPTIMPGLIWTQTIYKISRRQKLSLARKGW